jgi:hypothetical protein
MSRLLWNGEQWADTLDEAQLNIHLRAPDTGGKRFSWTWHLFHNDRIRHADRKPPFRNLSIEIGDLGFTQDWRQFSRFELRSSAQWQEENEYFGEYGHHFVPRISVYGNCLQDQIDENDGDDGFWEGNDFVLRFGDRDGFTFATEVEGWLEPRARYHRTAPESPAELARPLEGEPNLRLLTPTRLGKASVNLARGGSDPVPLARQYLEQCTGLTDLPEKSINWWGPKLLGSDKEAKGPGWRCTVNFEAPVLK